MATKQTERADLISHNQLVGSLSFGINKPQIFLRLCQVFRKLRLDIIRVDSHVRKGWFSKMIIARNKNPEGLTLDQFKRRINKVSIDLGFSSECFIVSEQDQNSELEPNVVVVLQSENKTGLLADLLEVLNQYNIDIVDIDIWMDGEEKNFALNIHTYIPTDADDFFTKLERIRTDLRGMQGKIGLNNFNCMVHSSETFEFIQKIDYERKEEQS